MTISGQYTTAEIFTENIEDAALQWVREQCDHPAFENVTILHSRASESCRCQMSMQGMHAMSAQSTE